MLGLERGVEIEDGAAGSIAGSDADDALEVLQVGVGAVGSLVMYASPPPSTATHSVVDGQSTASKPLLSMVWLVQAGMAAVGF